MSVRSAHVIQSPRLAGGSETITRARLLRFVSLLAVLGSFANSLCLRVHFLTIFFACDDCFFSQPDVNLHRVSRGNDPIPSCEAIASVCLRFRIQTARRPHLLEAPRSRFFCFLLGEDCAFSGWRDTTIRLFFTKHVFANLVARIYPGGWARRRSTTTAPSRPTTPEHGRAGSLAREPPLSSIKHVHAKHALAWSPREPGAYARFRVFTPQNFLIQPGAAWAQLFYIEVVTSPHHVTQSHGRAFSARVTHVAEAVNTFCGCRFVAAVGFWL